MAYKKIDKEFCLTDDSVNAYGYRLLTSGLQLDRFNPAIGFLMHDRSKGVAIRWEDLRIEDGKLYGKPVVNESAFPELSQQIEDGFYSAASVGHIVALETTDEEKYRLKGQTGVTVTKWFPRECSIVDIPANYNAIAISKLYDEADNVLHDLTDTNQHPKNMAKNPIDVTVLGLPDLSTEASLEEVQTKIRDLVAEAAKVPSLQKEINDLKAAANSTKVQSILEKGLSERRITKELADKLKADYAGNPEALESLVAAMPKQTIVTPQGGSLVAEIPEKYRGKTFRDLYLSGELAEVKHNYPDLYNQLKNEQ